jgi:mRNA-degrading endonuclease RelE of RelBE toxin-antitoxin system
MITVRIQDEVLDYLRCLAPKPRHAIRLAIKQLTDELEGYHRLRIGSHRVIFEYEIIDARRVITCIHAGPRKWIYEVFHNRLME